MGVFACRKVFTNDSFEYVTEVDLQLESFREYIALTEENVVKDIEKQIKAYNKFLEEASEIEIEHMHDFVDHEIKINTRQLYYHSLFISLYSFLERKMFQLCRISEPNQSLKIKDISGEGIFKFYTYIKKVLKIDVDALNTEWTEITKYNKLRNRIVHFPTNTIDKTDNDKLINQLKSIQHLTLNEKIDFFEFEITDTKLLLEFCFTTSKFLFKIYHEEVKL